MNKIKITGIKNLAFEGELNENKEYLVSFIGALDGIFQKSQLGEEIEPKTYHLKADRIELVQEIGGRQIKVEQGFTESQKTRLAIRDWGKRINHEDLEALYEQEQKKIQKYYNQKDI